jgi:hypothetical protein
MTGRSIVVALATLVMVTTAAAETVTLHSFDDPSCGKWSSLRDHDTNSRGGVIFWARGFISGYNWFNTGNQVTRTLSNETISAYIDKFCRDYPLKEIPQAVMHLVCETHVGAEQPFLFCEAIPRK